MPSYERNAEATLFNYSRKRNSSACDFHISTLDAAKVGTATAPGIGPIRRRLPNHRVLAVPIFALFNPAPPEAGLDRVYGLRCI
jgi:hypothetical protein